MRTKVVNNHPAAPAPHLIFKLGDQHYALMIEHVLEVAAMVELVTTPDVDAVFLGIANRHGEPLPMLDLRPVFQQSDACIDTSTLFIVAWLGDQRVGLVVDEVLRIEYLDTTRMPRYTGSDRFVDGVLTYGEHLIQFVALPSLLAHYLPQHVPAYVESGQVRS
jgi:purine-binding chemotaxis protein CheW